MDCEARMVFPTDQPLGGVSVLRRGIFGCRGGSTPWVGSPEIVVRGCCREMWTESLFVGNLLRQCGQSAFPGENLTNVPALTNAEGEARVRFLRLSIAIPVIQCCPQPACTPTSWVSPLE